MPMPLWNQPWCTLWRQLHENLNLEQTAYQIPNQISVLCRPNSTTRDVEKIVTLFGQGTNDALFQISIVACTGPDI